MSYKALISPCTSYYVKALTNPFGKFKELPCIPDVISLPSYKFMARTRGSFVIGLLGTGFVGVKPFTPYNDLPTTETTTGAYNSGFYIPFPQPGVVQGNNNSPFLSIPPTAPPLEFRLVGCGVRAAYQGSEFQRSGLVVLHREPGNGAIPAGSNSVNLLENYTTSQAPAIRAYESVNYRPDTPNQLGYTVPNLGQATTLLIFVEGGTPGTVWNYEVIQFFEMIGNRQNMTASHADPVGMGAALAALPASNPTIAPELQEKRTLMETGKNIMNASSNVISILDGIGSVGKLAMDMASMNFGGMIEDYSTAMSRGSPNSIQNLARLGNGPIVTEVD
jgi:hypothetical protein